MILSCSIEPKPPRCTIEDHYDADCPTEWANHDEIAQSLKISNQETLDFLDMLELQEYVRLSKFAGGAGARLTAQGRLLLTHPEYMLNKGYGDASEVLRALEKAVIDSEDIPQSKKDSLIEKLNELYHDPYMQNIGSGLIVEGLKKAIGI